MSVSSECSCVLEGVKRYLSTSALDGPVFVHGNVCPVRGSGMNSCVHMYVNVGGWEACGCIASQAWASPLPITHKGCTV